jgi:hypothetical protein
MVTETNTAIPTTTQRKMTDIGRVRRAIAAALVLATLLPVAGYLATASQAVASVRGVRATALVAGWRLDHGSIASIAALPETVVETAVAARPLDPVALNVAMVRDISRNGESRLARWIPTLSALGWRDTTSLQNRIYAAATSARIRPILDISDALMRRRQVQEQIVPVMAMVENDPALRTDFVARLAHNPGWRDAYLFATGYLKTPAQFRTRYEVLQALRRSGIKPGNSVMVSNINALALNGLPGLAFDLWSSSMTDRVDRPLHDPRFALASTRFATGNDPVPFEWEVTSGNGFGVTPYAENGLSALAIEWDGRGVPVFARQRTSAAPGRYNIDVDVPAEKVKDLAALGFQLICDGVAYRFERDEQRGTRFTMAERTPCSFPILEISGDIRAQAVPRQIELRQIRMTTVGPV